MDWFFTLGNRWFLRGHLKCLLPFLLLSGLYAGENVVDVLPKYKSISEFDKTDHISLNKSESLKNRIVIALNDGVYTWVNRNNHILHKISSGLCDMYIDTHGSGYVKVDNATGKVMEHRHIMLRTITYWGG